MVAAGHSRHADVFVTADRRYAAAFERVREWAPVDFAHVRRIPGTGSAVSGVANGAAQESNLPSLGCQTSPVLKVCLRGGDGVSGRIALRAGCCWDGLRFVQMGTNLGTKFGAERRDILLFRLTG